MGSLTATEALAKLKKIFTIKDNNSIGVDIGTSSVKVVELQRSQNKIFLKNYATIKVKQELVKTGLPGLLNPQTGPLLVEIFKRTGIKGRKINIAVPGYASLITTIEVPSMDESEIEAMVNVEAPKYIPIPLKDVIYGWQVIAEKKEPSAKPEAKAPSMRSISKMRVLLVALMQDVSKRYEEVLYNAGFQLKSIEVDSFSMKRSIVGNDKGNYIILDVGERVTNIIITMNGTIAMSRNIDIAGSRITDIISRGLNVTPEKAEQLKLSSGLKLDAQFKSSLITSTVNSITIETRRAIDNFVKAFPGQTVEGIILNGGTAFMPGFREYLEECLKLRVILSNPWSRISYPPEKENALISYGPFFSVAVGLALLGFEDQQ